MKNELKIMREKNDISDEEIFNRMDFDKLLEMRNKQVAAKSRKVKIGAAIFLLLLIMLSVTFFWVRKDQKIETPSVSKIIKPELKVPVVKPQEVVKEKTSQNPVAVTKAPKEKKEVKTKPKTYSETGYKEAMPHLGYGQLFNFFEQNLQYPEVAKANKTEGTVMVEFYVNAEGKPEEIVIVKGISEELNKEAIRLVSIMPAWDPATYEGNKISAKTVLPLTFKLDR